MWFFCGVDRMNPYGCIATGREEGMIEIVTPSMTISKIQKWYNKGAFAKEALYEWLKFKNPKEERYPTYLHASVVKYYLC